jgi:hypothetical protein
MPAPPRRYRRSTKARFHPAVKTAAQKAKATRCDQHRMTLYALKPWRLKMAHSNSTTNEPASTIAAEPIHKEFSWLPSNIKNDQNAQFAEMALIVAQGARTIASIVRSNTTDLAALSDGAEVRPLLGAYEIDSLIGLMSLSLTNLYIAAEERIDRLDFEARKGAK